MRKSMQFYDVAVGQLQTAASIDLTAFNFSRRHCLPASIFSPSLLSALLLAAARRTCRARRLFEAFSLLLILHSHAHAARCCWSAATACCTSLSVRVRFMRAAAARWCCSAAATLLCLCLAAAASLLLKQSTEAAAARAESSSSVRRQRALNKTHKKIRRTKRSP
jgi:hypothetical protein